LPEKQIKIEIALALSLFVGVYKAVTRALSPPQLRLKRSTGDHNWSQEELNVQVETFVGRHNGTVAAVHVTTSAETITRKGKSR
jgi:hypothetical protein